MGRDAQASCGHVMVCPVDFGHHAGKGASLDHVCLNPRAQAPEPILNLVEELRRAGVLNRGETEGIFRNYGVVPVECGRGAGIAYIKSYYHARVPRYRSLSRAP